MAKGEGSGQVSGLVSGEGYVVRAVAMTMTASFRTRLGSHDTIS